MTRRKKAVASYFHSLEARNRTVALVSRAVRDLWKHRMPVHSGDFAFNAFLSLFALILFLSSMLGFLLHSYPELHERIMDSVYGALPDFGGVLERTLRAIAENRQVVGVIGLIALIWVGTRIIVSIEKGFWEIWPTEKRGYLREKLLGLLVILVLGILGMISVGIHLGVSALVSSLSAHLGSAMQVLSFLSSLVIRFAANFIIFFSIYMIVPNRTQPRREVAIGALTASVIFLVLQYILDFYFETLSNATMLYGLIGVFISVLIWLYLSGMVVFFGAELIAVLSKGKDAT